jgi:hypothetical protein
MFACLHACIVSLGPLVVFVPARLPPALPGGLVAARGGIAVKSHRSTRVSHSFIHGRRRR